MNRNVATIVLLAWATLATMCAWGFYVDSAKHLQMWERSEHERYELLVKHEGWIWFGHKTIAFKPPPIPSGGPVR
jgi:hypothetical protein